MLGEKNKTHKKKSMAEVPEEVGENAVETAEQPIIPSSPYSRIQREISEEDLESPAVQRILLGEVDKLQSRICDLELIEQKYHIADKKSAILEEKLASMNSHEVLYSLCLAVGSIIIGLSPLVWSGGYGWVAISVGSILLIGGIASKVMKWLS